MLRKNNVVLAGFFATKWQKLPLQKGNWFIALTTLGFGGYFTFYQLGIFLAKLICKLNNKNPTFLQM